MPSDAATGLRMLCCITGVPFILGVVIGTIFSGRVREYGVIGALLPGFIRNRFDL